MNFIQYVAAYVVARFTFRAVDRHGVSMLRALGAIVVVFLLICWLYS